MDRLQALTAFEQVKALFEGVITARNGDKGDLLTQDNSSGSPMFSIARDDVLRIAVYVPQSSAIGIHDGVEAQVTVPEMPGRIFKGRVARNSAALQQASRSMLTEVDIANPDGVLRPGLFVNVAFSIPRQAPAVVVPDAALVFNASGLGWRRWTPPAASAFRKSRSTGISAPPLNCATACRAAKT